MRAECDILRGRSKHTLTPPTYIQGVRTPQPRDLHPSFTVVAGLLGACSGHGARRHNYVITAFDQPSPAFHIFLAGPDFRPGRDGFNSTQLNINTEECGIRLVGRAGPGRAGFKA